MLAEIPSSAIVVANPQQKMWGHKSGDSASSRAQYAHNYLFCNKLLCHTQTCTGLAATATYNQKPQYVDTTKAPQLRKKLWSQCNNRMSGDPFLLVAQGVNRIQAGRLDGG